MQSDIHPLVNSEPGLPWTLAVHGKGTKLSIESQSIKAANLNAEQKIFCTPLQESERRQWYKKRSRHAGECTEHSNTKVRCKVKEKVVTPS